MSTDPMRPCFACLSSGGSRTHVASELMFGMPGRFTYLECAVCGSLELLDRPSDLSPYYLPAELLLL